jgi:hypothetical protein
VSGRIDSSRLKIVGLPFFCWQRHADDFCVESAGGGRRRSLLMALRRERVLRVAADAPFGGTTSPAWPM